MPQKKGTKHKSPKHKIDRRKKYVKDNVFAKGQRKFEPDELETLLFEYLDYATNKENKTLCSQAGFITWLLLKKKMYITEMTLLNYLRTGEYEFLRNLKLVQRQQIEEHAMHGVMGFSGPMALMMKNVGYKDQVENVISKGETIFSLDEKPKNNIKKNQAFLENIDIEEEGGQDVQ